MKDRDAGLEALRQEEGKQRAKLVGSEYVILVQF